MEVAMRRKIGASGGTPGLWKTDWDSMAALLSLSTSSPLKDQQLLQGDDQNEKPCKVTMKEDESKNAEEKDSSTDSIMEGPRSSANMFSPSSSHNPQPLDCSSQNHTLSSPPTKPSVPQPQELDRCKTVDKTKQDQYDRKDKSNEAEEDFTTNSYLESPHSSANMLSSSSTPCKPPVFSHNQQNQSFPHYPPKLFWRPWEDETSESKMCLSPISPDPPPRRLISRVKKRRRSPGDLAKRRQRLNDHQNNQAHLFPHTPEPEQSRLESGSWAGDPLWIDWTCSGGSSDFREDPPSQQSWWSSPSPAPQTSPPWLTSNMTPPSPVYCDGCQRWGNLLSVTVSQTRGL